MEPVAMEPEQNRQVSVDTHANNFDFLRYLFACLVILFHALLYLHQPNDDEVMWQYTRGQQDTGSLAVNGFFVISGFLITASWLRCKSAGEFVKRRFLRIYPGFAATVLLTIFVVAPLGGATLPFFWQRPTTQDFVSVLWLQDVHDMLPNAFKHNPQRFFTNGALWTIRYEIVCYALVALLGACRLLRWRGLILALFLVSLLWYNHVLNTPYAWWIFEDWGRFSRLLCFFLAGMCAYLYRDRIRYTPLLLLPALGLLLAIPSGIGRCRFASPIWCSMWRSARVSNCMAGPNTVISRMACTSMARQSCS